MAEKREGRILRSISGFYEVQTPQGLVTCRARGSLRRGDSPLTGDLVEITVEKANKGMVEKILPRRNKFIRPAVANVDALVVFAANVNPITEPFLIDRVAAIAGEGAVAPAQTAASTAGHQSLGGLHLIKSADGTQNASFPFLSH